MTDWIIPWWGWFIFGFLLLLLELSAPGGFYFLFFGVGALSVGILAWLSLVQQAWVQLTFFSILTIMASLLFRKPLLARFGATAPGGTVDSLVGEAATVVEDMKPGALGKVELRGASWNARNCADRILLRGERCKVDRVDGLMLWIRGEES